MLNKNKSWRDSTEGVKYRMLRGARERARKKGLPCTITIEDLNIPEVCPVFGTKLEAGTKVSYANSPSLDKIDPTKGYIKGNIQIISMKANTMKSNASTEELLQFANWVFTHCKDDIVRTADITSETAELRDKEPLG